jgi:subtilisin family serine protease
MFNKEKSMKPKLLRLFVLIMVVSLVVTPVSALPLAEISSASADDASLRQIQSNDSSQKIEPELLSQLELNSKANGFVLFKDQADLNPAYEIKDWVARGQFVVDTLQQTAERSQKNILNLLENKQLAYTSFWVNNSIYVTADLDVFYQLASYPEVDQIKAEQVFDVPHPEPEEVLATINAVEWGIASIMADQVWADFGIFGDGIIVGSIDTGVQYNHPALVNQYRGNLGGGNFDHNYNWHDPSNICGNPSLIPCDNNGHGTHVTGTMVGDDGGANQIGVAPGAKWISAKGCEDNSCSQFALLSSGEWILAPTDLSGDNPDVTKRPHIINNSWGGGNNNDPWYQPTVQAWVAAGIFPAFAIGNAGPTCGSAGNPGNMPEAYGVGGYNSSDGIYVSSSRGTSAWGGIIKPNISAPGQSIRSSVPTNNYATYSGTSMASPHVSGAVALMWSAAPDLAGNILATRAILDETARDRDPVACGGTPENNNDWGEGQLDAYAAVLEAIAQSNAGMLQGTVTDSLTSDPISGAKVEMVSDEYTYTTFTDTDGFYPRLIPEDTYTVTVSAYGYFPATESDVEVYEDQTTTLNFALDAAPTYTVDGTVSDAVTGWPLYAEISIDGYPLGAVWTNPQTGDYSVSLAGGQIYNFHVNAWVDGYLATSRAVGPLTGNQVENFQLDVDALSCNALGYQPVYEFFDDFEGGTSNWTMSGLWNAESEADTCGALVAPFPSPVQAVYYGDDTNCNFDVGTNTDSLTMINPVSIPAGGALLTYWSFEETECGGNCPWDKRYTEVSIDGGTTWITIGEGHTEGVWHQRIFDLSPYAGEDLHLRFRFNSVDSIANNYFGWMVDDIVIATGCEPQPGGLIVGNVYDGNTGDGLVNASISSDMGFDTTSQATPLDPNIDDGFYTLFGPQGTNELTASKSGYGLDNAVVMAIDGETIRQDFNLTAGFLQADPENLLFDVPMGSSMTVPFDLQNQGAFDVQFEIREIPGGYSPMFSSGHIPKPLERLSGYESLAMTTEGLFVLQTQPISTDLLAAGDVLNFWFSGHTLSWGTGFSLNEEMVWVNDNQVGGGNGLNEEFTVDGSLTGVNFTPSFGGSWPGDMAYNPNTGLFWQVNVGGDNCIYEWDPTIPDVTGNSICGPGWTGTSQRGLAYNPDVDTFFIGGWNDATVYEIDTSGATVKSCTMNLPISGLAYNWEAGLLFAMLNASPNTIEVIDWASCSVIDSITVAGGAFPAYSGAGMGIDCSGNLWAANQDNSNIYLIDSGVPANLCAGVPWLSTDPTSGAVPAEDSLLIEVILDASVPEVTQPGLYQATLRFLNDTPYGSLNVPVSMNVIPPDTFGKIEATVTGLGYCDLDPNPIHGAEVLIESNLGVTWELTSDEQGYFQLWMDESHSPLTITVTYNDHENGIATDVIVVGLETTTVDFDLRWLQACISVDPEVIEFNVVVGTDVALPIEILNNGAAATDFSIIEIQTVGMVHINPPAVSGTPREGSTTRQRLFDTPAPAGQLVPLADNLIQDGSFEAGTPNPFWDEGSTNFGTPLCTIASCGTGTGTGPRTGDWWTWFGGISAVEAGFVSQDVTIPFGEATLTFWLEQIVCTSPADYLEVLIDGIQVFETTGDSPLCGVFGYSEVVVDVSTFADGNSHTIEFYSLLSGAGVTNFFVDDVVLDVEEYTEVDWLSVDSIEGTVPADDSFEVMVTADSLDYSAGITLTAALRIITSDPLNPIKVVPVTMNVVAIAYGVELTTEDDAFSG